MEFLMKINEIFYSLQGEGNWIGLPNIFIRATGCNLRCSYCDTTYAYTNGKNMCKDDILKKILKYPCNYICLTGGEPLLQEETFSLIKFLLQKGYKICLETNGSIDIKQVTGKKSLLISLDIKCPSSGMENKMLFNNISYLDIGDQLKFIIKNRKDYEYSKSIIEKYKPRCIIYFQPVWGGNQKELSSWILNDRLQVRLGIQLHKIIWGNKREY
jgi:7-carboxy-7-deazaguanine synthase